MSYFSTTKLVYRSSIRQVEFSFAIIGLFFFSTGLTSILTSSGAGSFISPLRYLIILGSILGILVNTNESIRAIKRGTLIWPLFLLTVLSVAWSINPRLTIQSLRSDFIPTTLFGLYLPIRFNRREIFNILYITTLLGSIISIFYAVALPSIGRHPFNHDVFPGAWRGIFSHKNGLGFNLALNNVCLGLRLLYDDKKLFLRNLIIFIIISCEILVSKSMSALAISSLVIFAIWVYGHYRWRGKITALFLNFSAMFIAIFSGALAVLWVPMMNALGRDPTLTGRTLIWDYLLKRRIAAKPILGHGRATLWKEPSVYGEILKAAHHIPSHAHNGYIDLLVDLGYSGLFAFIVSLISILQKTIRLAYKATHYENVWPLAFILFFMAYNISESLLLRGASFTWILYVAVSCCDLTRSDVNSI